jgi:DNA-binding NarL/FixJ family response regulator
VSEAQRAEIANLARKGWGRRAIASRMQLSERAVRNTLTEP